MSSSDATNGGGGISADVIREPPPAQPAFKKHIGNVKHEALEVQLGLSLSRPVYDWISASWTSAPLRKSGVIIACDYNLEAQSQREFTNALITETTIPASDGASKDPAYLTVKLSPETVRFAPSSGKVAAESSKGQRQWLPSNFRLEIDGLDCTRVSKIDSFTISMKIQEDDIGDSRRDYLRVPGRLEFPNLAVTLSEASAQSWLDWHRDFVLEGKNDASHERSGSLTLLSPDFKDELARIDFIGLGIFGLRPDRWVAASDKIKRITFTMYVEKMKFEIREKT